MGIDTIAQRTSAGGTIWPSGTLDRVAATEEYSWLIAGPYVPPEPVGIPELRRLTMHRTADGISSRHGEEHEAIGHSEAQTATRRTEDRLTIARSGTKYSTHRR